MMQIAYLWLYCIAFIMAIAYDTPRRPLPKPKGKIPDALIYEIMDGKPNFDKDPQEYIYQTNPDATPVRANLRKDGKYYIGNQVLKIGYRNEHYDYSF